MKVLSPQIGLEEAQREQVSQLLQKLLANTAVLQVKTQVSHWNVVDPQFYSLHQLFEQQYEQLSEALDEIAERIRMIGNLTSFAMKDWLAAASLQEYDRSLSAPEMIKALLEDHEQLCRELRESIAVADDQADDGTADFLTARLQEHEKTAWMLRSSL